MCCQFFLHSTEGWLQAISGTENPFCQVGRRPCLILSEGRGPLFQAPHWFVELIFGLRWYFPVGCGLQNKKISRPLQSHSHCSRVELLSRFFANQITKSFFNKIIFVVYMTNLYFNRYVLKDKQLLPGFLSFFFFPKIKGC